MDRTHAPPLPDLLKRRSKRRPAWQRVLLIGGAIVAFIAGIVGWLVPVMTGIPFYIVGLVLLGLASTRMRLWINKVERKMSHKWRLRLRHGMQHVPLRWIRDMMQPYQEPR